MADYLQAITAANMRTLAEDHDLPIAYGSGDAEVLHVNGRSLMIGDYVTLLTNGVVLGLTSREYAGLEGLLTSSSTATQADLVAVNLIEGS